MDDRGSYTAVARYLNKRFSHPVFDRRQVQLWHRRGTFNAIGQRFPEPVEEIELPKRTTPRYIFDFELVGDWVDAGIPGPYGRSWRYPYRR
jgi:hypothetical protein